LTIFFIFSGSLKPTCFRGAQGQKECHQLLFGLNVPFGKFFVYLFQIHELCPKCCLFDTMSHSPTDLQHFVISLQWLQFKVPVKQDSILVQHQLTLEDHTV